MNKLLLFVLFVLNTHAYAIGHDVGNGGQVISCAISSKTFSLDYVLAKEAMGSKMNLVDVNTSSKSLSRIEKLIKTKLPMLSPSFSEFVNHLNNRSDISKPYIWIKAATSELEESEDQNYDRLKPGICGPFSNSTVAVEQVVIRTLYSTGKLQNHVAFTYNDGLLNSLHGVHLSFLFVHEWLWGITDDVVLNRKINYFLHSELFDKVSAAEATKQLKSYGLDLNAND